MYAFKIVCWALIFIFRLRFPPGVSIATILYSSIITSQKLSLQQFRVIRDHLNSKCLTSIIVFDIQVQSLIQ